MTITAPPLDLLPKPSLLIGDQRINDTSGGVVDHIYGPRVSAPPRLRWPGRLKSTLPSAAARAALPGWRATTPDQRRELLFRAAQILREHAEEITAISQIDNSMPVFAASGGPLIAADQFAYNAGWADKLTGDVVPTWPTPSLDYVTREPYGVVGIIIPWNGPVYAMGMTVAPALAAAIVFCSNPLSSAPYSATRIAELFLEAGFPPGYSTS